MVATIPFPRNTIALTAVFAIAFSSQLTCGEDIPPIKDHKSYTANVGMLIVDGVYVAPPYVFESNDNGIFVNQTPLNITSLGLEEADFWRWEMIPPESESESGEPAEVRFRRTAIRPQFPWRIIESGLQGDSLVVVNKGERPVSLYSTDGGSILLKMLSDDARRANVTAADLKDFRKINQSVWLEWIHNFQPTAPFLTHAKTVFARGDAILAKSEAAVEANRRLEAGTYPLTVIGMVLVVLAVGHLLNYRPPATARQKTTPLPAKENRAVMQCLVLIVFLSALDLVWTLLAHQAGAMKELNPIGSTFIDDPGKLILFKVIATLIGTGLLFSTRQFVLARKASWWCCLTCTLLAARWLSVNSLMA